MGFIKIEMVLISDGNSEIGAHVLSKKSGNLICLRHLFGSRAVANHFLPIFLHTYETCSELRSNISTMKPLTVLWKLNIIYAHFWEIYLRIFEEIEWKDLNIRVSGNFCETYKWHDYLLLLHIQMYYNLKRGYLITLQRLQYSYSTSIFFLLSLSLFPLLFYVFLPVCKESRKKNNGLFKAENFFRQNYGN